MCLHVLKCIWVLTMALIHEKVVWCVHTRVCIWTCVGVCMCTYVCMHVEAKVSLGCCSLVFSSLSFEKRTFTVLEFGKLPRSAGSQFLWIPHFHLSSVSAPCVCYCIQLLFFNVKFLKLKPGPWAWEESTLQTELHLCSLKMQFYIQFWTQL